MSLAKKAAGLPRFMLDCGWWRSPKWRGVTLDEMGLFQALVSYCHEHATDGVLPSSDDEELAMALGLRAKEVRKAKAAMSKRGVLVDGPNGLEIAGYADHNPTRREIEEDRARKTAAALKANHTRHHVERNRSDPDCELCAPKLRFGSESESQPDPPLSPEGREGREGTDGCMSSSSVTEEPPPPESAEEEFASQVIDRLADKDYRGHSGHVGNPSAYRATCREKRAGLHLDALLGVFREHPDMTVVEGCAFAETGVLPVRHRDPGFEVPPPPDDDEKARGLEVVRGAKAALRSA